MNANNIALNKKDGKTIHYMNSKIRIKSKYIIIKVYCFCKLFKTNILINTIKYNIDEIKSIIIEK